MKKLVFKYSAMNAGKSMHLIMTHHNYKELGLNPVAVVPNGSKNKSIYSRAGGKVKAIRFDELQGKLDGTKCDCILVDEVQFLTKEQIEFLNHITIKDNIPVICYGLRTTSLGELFEGASALLSIADELEELPTLCYCGNKARMNLRVVDGFVDKSREIVKMKEDQQVSYISMCRKCYFRNIKKTENVQYLVDNFSNNKIKKEGN